MLLYNYLEVECHNDCESAQGLVYVCMDPALVIIMTQCKIQGRGGEAQVLPACLPACCAVNLCLRHAGRRGRPRSRKGPVSPALVACASFFPASCRDDLAGCRTARD